MAKSFGPTTKYAIAILVSLLALASMTAWASFGAASLRSEFGAAVGVAYKLVFAAVVATAAMLPLETMMGWSTWSALPVFAMTVVMLLARRPASDTSENNKPAA